MKRRIPRSVWEKYKALLPESTRASCPEIPRFGHEAVVEPDGNFLPEAVVRSLRMWLGESEESSFYVLATETIGSEQPTDYEVSRSELQQESLASLGLNLECVLTGRDFQWAVFVNHEGRAFVGGPEPLVSSLTDQT